VTPRLCAAVFVASIAPAVGVTLTKEAIMTNETTAFNLALYDDVEVAPMKRFDYGDEEIFLDDHDDEEVDDYDGAHTPDYWCVFGHLKTGGRDALVDCVDERSAELCGAMLAIAMQSLAALQLAQRALNTAPRFWVDDTDSYKIAAKVDAAIARATRPNEH
jgi:hypothetical protein